MSSWRKLAGVKAFESFDEHELRKIARYAKLALLPARRYVRLDSVSAYVFIVISGKLRVAHPDQSGGREITLFECGADEVFGSGIMAAGLPLSGLIVRAVEKTEVAIMNAADFDRLLSLSPSMALWMARKLNMAAGHLVERLAGLALLSMRARLYLYLLRHSAHAERNGDGTTADFPIPSHGTIGAEVFASREAVTREFARLKRRGVFTHSRGHIRGLDRLALDHLFRETIGPTFSQYLRTRQDRIARLPRVVAGRRPAHGHAGA